MLLILLKSSACLLAFIAFYKVFLERTSNHQFKRYYLLAVVLVSIGIPFITFIEYIEPTFILGDFGSTPPYFPTDISLPQEETINFLPIILWSIYGLGALLFSARFGYNLIQILLKIKRNPKQKTARFINVLLQELTIPHTFFNYIFLNKAKFENKEIPSEVLLHEETHIKQKHSLDILFIELLQIVFWFNPLVYILKRDIRLNHEFLADQAVINQGINKTNYQKLLLAYSSYAEQPPLAHAINYSLIKKRLTIMKTKTSRRSMWLRSLLLLPLLAVLIFGFSTTKQVEKNVIPKITTEDLASSSNIPSSEHTARSISIKIFDNGTYEIDGIKATKNTFVAVINKLHQDITPEVRNQIMNIHVDSPKDISDKEVWFIYNAVQEYGYHRIVAYNQEIIREKGNTPFAITGTVTKEYYTKEKDQEGATKEQVAEYNSIVKKLMSQPEHKRIIKLKDVERIKYIYSLMTQEQKRNAEPFPKLAPPPAPAPKVLKGELSDVPPPPAPPASKVIKGEISKVPAPSAPKVLKGERSDVPPPPPAPEHYSPEMKQKYNDEMKKEYELQKAKHEELKQEKRKLREAKRAVEMEERSIEREKAMKQRELKMVERESKMVEREKQRELAMKERQVMMEKRKAELPPPPPPPKSPLNHVIDMSKKGATFYFEGKKITSDEAISIVKKNENLNISSNSDNGVSIVKISMKPVKTRH